MYSIMNGIVFFNKRYSDLSPQEIKMRNFLYHSDFYGSYYKLEEDLWKQFRMCYNHFHGRRKSIIRRENKQKRELVKKITNNDVAKIVMSFIYNKRR